MVEMFRGNALAHPIVCPECGVSTNFARSSLKLFGRQAED